MTQIPNVDEAVPQAAPEPALPLRELDHALAPLRRTLLYALSQPKAPVRYLEANGTRWLKRALALDLPEAVRETLVHMAGDLSQVDTLEPDERVERLRNLNQALTRVDALLGLPLPTLAEARAQRRSSGRKAKDPAKVKAKAKSPSTGRERSPRGRSGRPAEVSAPATQTPGHYLGASGATGRSIEEAGVAADLVPALNALGISVVADLFLLRPKGELVIRPVHGAGRAIEPGLVAVGGRVQVRKTVLYPDGRRSTRILLKGAGPLWVHWSQPLPPWKLDSLAPGARVVLVGDYRKDDEGEGLYEAELVADTGEHAVHLATYGLEGVEDRRLREEICRLLPDLEGLADPMPLGWLTDLDLSELPEALRYAHTVVGARPGARRRLAFDEALTTFLAQGRTRFEGSRERGIAHGVVHSMAARLGRFEERVLSDGEQQVLEAIKRDLLRPAPMLRLVTGETGLGCVTITAYATAIVAENKSQVMILAPESLVAEARFTFLAPRLRDMGLVSRLIDEQPTSAQRDAIRRGEVHVVFGTLALLERDLEFRRLGLVIAEEGGIHRRVANLVAALKAPRPDTLVLATTPVPTRALVRAYGDHDLSDLTGLLVHKVKTRVVADAGRQDAYERTARRVAGGEQAIVWFPMVRGHDALDAREAMRVKVTLETQIFAGAKVGLLHGAMSREEQGRVYEDFQHLRYDVLIATTLIEDAPAVPGAVNGIVEHADRLGHARINRIRGHLARASRPARCQFILGATPDPAGVAWLEKVLSDAPFAADLDWDEVADHLGEGSVAEPRFRWLQPERDRALVFAAHQRAQALLRADIGARNDPHAGLAAGLRAFWSGLFPGEPCPLPSGRPPATAAGRKRRRRRKRR